MAGCEDPYPSWLSLIMSQISRWTCKSPAEAAFSVALAVRARRGYIRLKHTVEHNVRHLMRLTNELADWS